MDRGTTKALSVRRRAVTTALIVGSSGAVAGLAPPHIAQADPGTCPLPPDKVLTKKQAPRGIDVSGCVLDDREIDLGVAMMQLPDIGETVSMFSTEIDGSTQATIGIDPEGVLTYSADGFSEAASRRQPSARRAPDCGWMVATMVATE